ncbi:MAG: hypothetical protein MUE65_06370, partial [Methanomassiliicoccales archaeon]|nr:hypothetical protein [Methanomassiliicoccales archaeon]
GPAIRAWSPRDGDHLLYHQTGGSAGGGQATDWDYLVRSVAEEGMVLNLTITTDAQPPQTILSGESVHPLENTSLGVAFCPYPSAGPFAVELVGNETLQTPYGPLECNHLLVLRLGNGTDDRWREDLFVRQGVLVRMERLDQDQFRMDLIETNLDL